MKLFQGFRTSYWRILPAVCSLTIVIISFSVATAQYCSKEYQGTKTLYTPGQQTTTRPPVGYHAVFINHLGRHGARHLTKEVSTSVAYRLFLKADSLQMLTPNGLKLFNMIKNLDKVEHGSINNITSLGKSEQRGIASRMTSRYPSLFNDSNSCVNVAVTNKVRTVQSAHAFLAGLPSNTKVCLTEYKVDDLNLRFYDLSPTYVGFADTGKWRAEAASVFKKHNMYQGTGSFYKQFFKTSFSQQLTEKQQYAFMEDVFGLASIVPSVKEEISQKGFTGKDVEIRSVFNCRQLQQLEHASSMEDFFTKGPGMDPLGVQVKVAVPLLVDFIRSTDNYVATKHSRVNLRFSHAEAVAPFAALLSISGASETTLDYNQFENKWAADKIIPLSANIQWVLYEPARGSDYLIKLLLNEKEVHISGLKAVEFPFYSWTSLRQFYIERLARLGTAIDQNMASYLENLK